MSIVAILGAKYGISLLKALYGLASGEPKAVTEFGLKWAEKRLDDWAKDREKQNKVERLRNQVLTELAQMPELVQHEDQLPAALALAADTLERAFSFDALFECLGGPSSLPRAWEIASDRSTVSSKDSKILMPDSIDEGVRSLHDLILRSTVSSLARHFDELPDFQAWFVRRVRQEVRDTRALKAAVMRLLSNDVRADVEFEGIYLESVQKKFDVVELFVERPDLAQESERQKLSVAYVTLDLTSRESGSSVSRTIPASSLLDGLPDGPKRVLCLGPAGSGKTTLMRWMGIEAARSRIAPAMQINRPQGEDWRDRVPFLIRLRQFKDGPWPTTSEFHDQGIDLRTPPSGWAERILMEGRGMLLIDGLDELRPERRRSAITWIKELIDNLPSQTVLAVTSRPQALEPGVLESVGFKEFAVRDLSPSAQKTFVDQWHAAVALSFTGQSEKLEKLEEKREKLIATLDSERAISVLARNPLLCALICALNRVYRTDLPKNLPDLCASACKMLLWDRDLLAEVKSKEFLARYTELTYSQRLHLTQSLAYDIVKAQADTISRDAALEIILSEMHLQGEGMREVAEEVLKGLVERSNLLRDAGEEEYEFAHNTLRDYLASTPFVRRRERSVLPRGLRGAEFARWEPVACFSAASETNPTFGIDLLGALLKPSKVDRPLPPRQEVFALKLSGHIVGFVPQEMKIKLTEIESRFLPVNSPSRARNLAAAGEAAVEHLRWRPGIEEETAAAMVEALGRIEAPSADEALAVWLGADHRPHVLDTLAQSVGYEELSKHVNLLTVPTVYAEMTRPVAIERSEWGAFIHDLTPLTDRAGIQSLNLGYSYIKDFKVLQSLENLEFLFLDGTLLESLQFASALNNLTALYVARTRATSLEPLRKLKKLKTLSMFGTPVSDLSPLRQNEELSKIWISSGQFSEVQINTFKADHPACHVEMVNESLLDTPQDETWDLRIRPRPGRA